ncbi:MAG: restriction endonuclease subunit S, partial [Prevotella sp.]|nr:restriction endonuclease subunit S [Prevotella sp.]
MELIMKNNWQKVKLGDIGKISMCKRIMKQQTSERGDIPFYKISTFGGEADVFITREIYEKYKTNYSYPKIGEILISAAGTLGKTVVFKGKPSYFQDSNIVWVENNELKNRYLHIKSIENVGGQKVV